MKTLLLLLTSVFAVLALGCEDTTSVNSIIKNTDDRVNYGCFDENTALDNIPKIVKSGMEINLDVNVVWSDGCVYTSYFKEEMESPFVYKFTLFEVARNGYCHFVRKKAKTSFRFNPKQKGEYTLLFIDQRDTITKKLTVF